MTDSKFNIIKTALVPRESTFDKTLKILATGTIGTDEYFHKYLEWINEVIKRKIRRTT